MAAVTMKIPVFYRRLIYFVFALAWCSGITFFVLRKWFQIEGEFGLENHPLQFLSLQIHGAAAFMMMILFGFMLGTHIPKSWRVSPKRKLGVTLMAMPIFLILTAYALYYGGDGMWRDVVFYSHLSVGFLLPLILIAHIIAGKRNKSITQKRRKWHVNSETKL